MLEIDFHDDSPFVGIGSLIFEKKGKTIEVNGFTPSLGSKRVTIVNDELYYNKLIYGKMHVMMI